MQTFGTPCMMCSLDSLNYFKQNILICLYIKLFLIFHKFQTIRMELSELVEIPGLFEHLGIETNEDAVAKPCKEKQK